MTSGRKPGQPTEIYETSAELAQTIVRLRERLDAALAERNDALWKFKHRERQFHRLLEISGDAARVNTLTGALEDAIALVEGLAEQQAMADDWYVERLNLLRKLASVDAAHPPEPLCPHTGIPELVCSCALHAGREPGQPQTDAVLGRLPDEHDSPREAAIRTAWRESVTDLTETYADEHRRLREQLAALQIEHDKWMEVALKYGAERIAHKETREQLDAALAHLDATRLDPWTRISHARAALGVEEALPEQPVSVVETMKGRLP